MELLEGVREELGEGRIRGIAFLRRLEFSSPDGMWELRLGGDEDGVYCTYFTFIGKKRFPAELHLGPRSEIPISDPWRPVRTGDPVFDSECSIWTKTPDPAGNLISEAVRRSIVDLWNVHPALSITVYPTNIVLTVPGLFHDNASLLGFLLKASPCAQAILESAKTHAPAHGVGPEPTTVGRRTIADS